MPQYKGVTKQELIDSVREGMDFIASLNIGPETNALCNKWQDGDVYLPIATAQTDEELSAAVKSTGVTAAFSLLTKALDFHAERDTIGQGKRVLENIAKWDGDKGARMMMVTKSDMEISNHISNFDKGFAARIENERNAEKTQRNR